MTIRVAFCSDALVIWGAERSLLEIVQATPGFKADILAHPDSPLLGVPDLAASGVAMAPRFTRGSGGIRKAPWLLVADVILACLYSIPLAVRLRTYDAVVCFGTWELLQVLPAAKMARRPCVLDLHETFAGSLGNRALRLLVGLCDGVIATSSDLATGLPESRVRIVGRPVRLIPAKVVKPRRAGAPLRLSMLGQVTPHKRVLEVAKICALMAPNSVELRVTGLSAPTASSEYEKCVRDVAKEHPEVVDVRERTTDVAAELAAADCLINASVHEAFGRTVVEAMQAGLLPIVVGDSGASEIVRRHGVGRVIREVSDLPRLLHELRALTADEWNVIRGEARAVGAQYAPSHVVPKYYQALTELISTDNRF
ncbi:glycosyltransferase family 4 protein [Nocardia sp. N13]|uniref:glycosyltransferase family 4 protein n=1 Tax=Nocardioides sp. N13(2025) TaxID=3453405 RepID=UPI003F76E27E